MQSLQSIGFMSWFSHYWSRNHFADLLNCETVADGDTNQPTEIAFWKTWDVPVIKGITGQDTSSTAVYMVTCIYDIYVKPWHYK